MHDVSPKAEPGTAHFGPTRTDLRERWLSQFTPDTREEVALIAHVRGHCHNSAECALCAADTEVANARVMAERQHARARTQELRAIDAEIQNAYLTRELMRTNHTLTSIIEG